MRKNKSDAEIEKVCEFCEYGAPAADDGTGNEYVFCSKKGLVMAGGKCHSFKYDLLKRQPQRNTELPEFKPVDLDD